MKDEGQKLVRSPLPLPAPAPYIPEMSRKPQKYQDMPNEDGPEQDFEPDLDISIATDLELDDEAAPESVKRGAAVIYDHWKTLPLGPGVYRMLNLKGEVLYVGKAKSLKKRVASYTRPTGHVQRIARMIAQTTSMVFMTTSTETEALLLEANLIKQLKPRFNVLMRDDKSFPYILLTKDHGAPQLTKHRGARNRKGDYFGPFANVGAVSRTLNTLQRAFLLRTCTDSYFENRSRPCLLYQIKRCSGPCTNEISPEGYKELVQETRDFLTGKSISVRERLASDMHALAENFEYERAAQLRDRISALSAIQGSQGINPRSVEEADVFAISQEAGQYCIEVFFFRTFQNWGNRAYFPRADKDMEPEEVLSAFLVQFYEDKPAPELILLSHQVECRDMLADALTERMDRKVEITVPQRGEKADLVSHALTNAREALARKLADTSAQTKLLAALGTTFGLEKPPRRVEIFDNSHIMGTNAIGAMVVAGPNGFMKTHYRTYNMDSGEFTPGDDYAMMRDMLKRRFERLIKDAKPQNELSAQDIAEDPDAFPSWPDLLLIDGGKGQYEATRQIMDELGVTGVALAAVAKGPDRDAGRETLLVEGKAPFRLGMRDPTLYFIQRLRDEAHRFAIGTHRARRKKDFTKSPLDEIAGIGPKRKRALLNAFGTAKAISRASLEDLEKVEGVNSATAKIVFNFFNDRL